MIDEVLMKTGGWDISLVPDAPLQLRQRIDHGAVVYILPGHPGFLEADNVRAQAIWGGMVQDCDIDEGSYSGAGLVGFLATGKGQAAYIPNYAALPTLPCTFAQFATQMFATIEVGNGIQLGDAHDPSATTVTDYDLAEMPGLKSALDYFAELTGTAWRITPQGKLDYGVPSTDLAPPRAQDPDPGLFKRRQILISPDIITPGDVGGWRLIRPTKWRAPNNIQNFRDQAVVINASRNDTDVVNAGSSTSFARLDGSGGAVFNNDAQLIAGSDAAGDITRLGTAAANRYATPQWDITCEVDLRWPSRLVVPGESLFVWDVRNRLVGDAHIDIPGVQVAPLEMTLYGVKWPVTRGMGVYVVDADDRDLVYDVTHFMEWETGPASLTLGSPAPRGYAATVADLID